MHTLQPYIGRRWSSEDNCWDMVREIYRDILKVTLPPHPAEALRSVGSRWFRLDSPVDMCIVAMAAKGHALRHAGVYLAVEGGLVLHCARPFSVVTPVNRLSLHGYGRHEFYRYEDSTDLPQSL